MNKKQSWIDTHHCKSRVRCKECLSGAFEDTSTTEKYNIPEECPFGITLNNLPASSGNKQKADSNKNEHTAQSTQSEIRCKHIGKKHEIRPCMRWCNKHKLYIKYSNCEKRDCYIK